MALSISQHRREEWCRPVEQRFLEALNRAKPDTLESFAAIWYRHNSEAGYYWELLARHHYDHSHLPTAEPAFEVPPFLFRMFINPVIMLHRILFSLSMLISMFSFIFSRLD